MKKRKKAKIKKQNQRNSDVRASSEVRAEDASAGETQLVHREADAPMRLYRKVISAIKNYFLIWSLTFIFGQLECLSAAVEAVLTAKPGDCNGLHTGPRRREKHPAAGADECICRAIC